MRVAFLPDGIPTVEAYVNAGHDKRALEAQVLAAPTFSDPSLAPTRDREVRPVPWLWPGRISLGGVTVLDSAYGSAMRLVAIDLAARVSTGRAMPDGASGLATAADVVVATHRGSSHTVLAGLEAAGADVSRVTHMACEVEDLLSETDLEALSSSIPDGTQLVVIDPGVCPAVASFPTPKGGAAARAALEWMQQVIRVPASVRTLWTTGCLNVVGLFQYRAENRDRIVQEIQESLSSRRNDSPFVTCGVFRGHRRGVRVDTAPGGHGRSGSTFPVSAGMDAGSIRTRCSSPTR